jgi:magnesium transporter
MYVRRQERQRDGTFYYVYVLDTEQRLVGVVSLRELVRGPGERLVREIMRREVITVPTGMDQEDVARRMAKFDLLAVPVVDEAGRIKGVVTIDDVIDVVAEEATEDIHKLGGSEALDAPYLDTSFGAMLRKRAGWLTILFVSEMLTATAMGYFQEEISRAVVLALFIPLIISSGGNSGSQASTLIVRALAVGDVRLEDIGRVFKREVASGLALGLILATIGFVRIVLWPSRVTLYGPHYLQVALAVAASLVGVVLWGTLSGSMLPFALRRLGFDPASASAPFVATLVDVTGLIIYFSVASVILRGTLL